MKKITGFSLIEIIVVIGILSLLTTSAFFIGFPEYNRYLLDSERESLVDALLESRARSLVSNENFIVNTWSNGYCIKDITGFCVVPAHNLPTNMILTSIDYATSTKMIIGFINEASSTFSVEINIDQNGFIEGR